MSASRGAQAITLLLHCALVLGLPLAAGKLGLLLALPLLVPLPGLYRGRSYTYAWCSLLLVFYLGGFLMEAYTHPARKPVALGLSVFALVEFCALMLFVRFAAVERRRQQAS
jgi:uncharacterized membrane protein